MANIEAALWSRLTTGGHSGTTALIADRCYPLRKPQAEKRACVVYQLISPGREVIGGSDSGLANPRYQFRCIAPSYSAASALATQVTAALRRWSGTEAGEVIQGSFPAGGGGAQYDEDDGDEGTHSFLLDFRIWHLES